MMTNLEKLNALLEQRTDLPQHRRYVSPSLNNLAWLKKSARAGGELLRLLSLKTSEFAKPYQEKK